MPGAAWHRRLLRDLAFMTETTTLRRRLTLPLVILAFVPLALGLEELWHVFTRREVRTDRAVERVGDLLERMAETGLLRAVDTYLVQFHEWHPGAYRRRRGIRRALAACAGPIRWRGSSGRRAWDPRTPAEVAGNASRGGRACRSDFLRLAVKRRV